MAPSMQNRTWVYAIVGVALLAGLVVALAGDLEPPGPPSPTMESLIRADDLPMNITVPGSYALAEDITTAGGGISVSVSDVTIDLRGHTLAGGTGSGIGTTAAGLKNIVVKNGTIRGWSGSAVDLASNIPVNSQVLHVLAEGNLGDGIRIYGGGVFGCAANGNSGDGIDAAGTGGTIEATTATSNSVRGFYVSAGAWTITNCNATLNTQSGFDTIALGTSIFHCVARDNNGDGITVTSGGSILSSSAYSNGDSAGDDGIVGLGAGATISECTSVGNFEDGFEVTSGYTVRGNVSRANGGAGINVTSAGNRIEENNVTANTGDGINVNPATGNFILRNSASANTGIAFDLAAGNSYGLVTAGAAGFSNSNSWANYTY